MEKYVIITTLCKDKNVAGKICDSLLNKHLVAGCQVSKVTSKYWYNGGLQLANEYKLDFRTVESFYDLIEAEIKEIHEYETPEISMVEIRNASDEFIEWIDQYTVELYSDDEEEQEETSDDSDFGLI